MKLGELMKNAPNALIWSVALCFVAILGAFTFLSATGENTEDLWVFINRLFNIAGALFGGGALVVAGAAAKSAGNAEKQTNGDLDARLRQAIRHVNAEENARPGNIPPGL